MSHIITAFVGMFIGALMSLWFAVHVPLNKIKIYNDAITECEKSLPRDQNCVIVALPKSYD